jgi:hypothetical protein
MSRKGLAAALKGLNSSLGHLASYARIAIHIGEFSPEVEKMAQRTRNKIAQSAPAALRVLPVIPAIPQAPPAQDPDPCVEES